MKDFGKQKQIYIGISIMLEKSELKSYMEL